MSRCRRAIAHVRRVRVMAVACAALIALAACGGSATSTRAAGGTPTPATTPATRPTAAPDAAPVPFPDLVNTEVQLAANTYVTSSFDRPTLTMTLDGPWMFSSQDGEALEIIEGTDWRLDRLLLVFRFYGHVIDPTDDHTVTETHDLISWIEQNPHVAVIGEPASIRIDGVEAQQIDIQSVDAPPCAYWQDGSRCWNLIPLTEGDPFSPEYKAIGSMFVLGSDPATSEEPFSYRLVLADFGGDQVVFTWQDFAATFGETVQIFDKVLASIEVS